MIDDVTLAATYADHAPGSECRGLEGALVELVDTCRCAVPDLEVTAAQLVGYLAARNPEAMPAAEWIRTAHAIDLYVACACATGSTVAIGVFHARHAADINRVLRGVDRRGFDDARQILDHRLFVGPAPKIATYTGRGPLGRWLRVVLGRLLLEVIAKREPLADDWDIAALPVATDNPQLAFLKERCRVEYKLAFADALSGLPDRERTILAQYHVDGLTIDELGALYRVHRVTASRWVIKAQDLLRQRLVALLEERLGLSPDDVTSVTRMVRSQLSLSLARLVRPDDRI
jgi:RNA polymerase sigma-70 factor (ECF subfamily)